ncbi:PqqD family protein [Ancylobacter sp. IITR112]|uniref:PqqD family protein n=1 Tax=Ancylobacter sp. IITR112 TaxID=3138073 RepID=UPI00352A2423
MVVSAASEVVRRSHPLAADVGDTQVLLDIEQGLYFGLNAIASSIWRRLEQPVRVDALCRALEADYAADAGRLEADVLAFLAQLEAQNLIDVRG